MSLSAAVRQEIQRLGGLFVARPPNAGAVTMSTIRGRLVLPEPLRCFGEVRWPAVRSRRKRNPQTRRLTYRSRGDDEPSGISLGLFDISEDYTEHGDVRPYVGIAIDCHYYMHIVRIEDECSDDPDVFRIDHEGCSEDLDRVGGPPLSAFLADLIPDPSYYGPDWEILDPPADDPGGAAPPGSSELISPAHPGSSPHTPRCRHSAADSGTPCWRQDPPSSRC